MKQAPETGYSPELVLEWKDLQPTSFTPERVYFFFKAGKIYGRGIAGYPKLSADRKSVAMWLSIKIQPDLTRNLETGE